MTNTQLFRMVLISTPLWAVLNGPALALPALVGLLREHGIDVTAFDFNIETIASADFTRRVSEGLEEEFRDLNALDELSAEYFDEILQGLIASSVPQTSAEA